MQIFIMRHGQAGSMATTDSQRELTQRGFFEASVMAKWLNDKEVTVSHVFVSPYVRAQQTANTLMADNSSSAKLSTLDFITPEGNAKIVHDYLDGVFASETINKLLIVSHMPLVSYLVEELTAESACPVFQTASIAQIEYDTEKMKGQLVRLIAPYDVA
ncbi:phosphohistidine phosphatase SixA [bacterium]|nr:phosphohistidine phosphatase SixA [bacterium]